MLIQLPQSEKYNRVCLVLKSSLGTKTMTFGEPHKTVEVDVPVDGEVTVQYLDNGSCLIGNPTVLVKPKQQFKLEVKDEEAPESADSEMGEGMVEDAPTESLDMVEDTPEPVVEKPVEEPVEEMSQRAFEEEMKKPRRRRSQ